MAELASDFYPETILREAGGLTASVYRCQGQQGEYFMTTFARIFGNDKPTALNQTDVFLYPHLASGRFGFVGRF